MTKPRAHIPLRVVLGFVVVSLALGACGGSAPSPDPATPGGLAGTTWRVVSVDGRVAVAGREPTATFSATRIEGSGGCNSYGGDYRYDADTATLTVGEVASTMMGCVGPEGTFEGLFHGGLRGALRVSIDGELLTLARPGGSIVLVDIGDNTGG